MCQASQRTHRRSGRTRRGKGLVLHLRQRHGAPCNLCVIQCLLAHFSVKRTEPKGAFEHRAIKELIIKTIFTASKGMDCLADAFEDGETHLFNPVPLETIALAATAVLSDIMVRYSFRILTLYTLDLLCSYRMEGWSAFPCSF